jgi:PAS domain S-box-containing protein
VADGGALPTAWRGTAFGQLADASLDGIWACDRERRCLYWNAAMEEITGLPAARVLGYGIGDVLVRTGLGDPEAAIGRVLAGETKVVSMLRVGSPGAVTGSILRTHHLAIGDPIDILGVAAIVRDVTEEDRIRQELHETDARFRNMADAAPVLLWMSRADGLCTFFNQTWLAFTGRTMEEEWGIGWAESVHYEDLEACFDTYREAFNARRTFEMEYRLRRADGVYRWLLDRGAPRYEPDGRFAGYIGSCVDITERRELETDLRAAIAARDDFLAVASHELGTPLTALRLNIEGLTRVVAGSVSQSPRTVADRVAAISRDAGRLDRLAEALLDSTRLQAGRWKLAPERVDLGELAETVVASLAPVAESARCPVTVQAAHIVGNWDRARLEQALTNVLGNAFKYGACAPVEVTVETAGGAAVARVRDHGVGLPADQQALIFERFGRAPHTNGYGGLGLGLWIARRWIEAMGGTIRIASRPGEGASFEIALPLVSAR